MRFVDLTQHDPTIVLENGDGLVLPASGEAARVAFSARQVDEIDGVPIFETVCEPEVAGLPEPEDGTVFIVSSSAARTARRHDVLAPAKLIRDDDGRVVAAGGFAAFCQRLAKTKKRELLFKRLSL